MKTMNPTDYLLFPHLRLRGRVGRVDGVPKLFFIFPRFQALAERHGQDVTLSGRLKLAPTIAK